MSRIFAAVIVFGIAGCLGQATVTNPPHDLSANAATDLSQGPGVDLFNADAFGDGGPLSNCGQLNACERACTNQACVMACRAHATAAALTKELTLQGCFNMYCPEGTDAGAMAICTPNDMGAFSASCSTCIMNSQIAPANSCTGTAPECHQCYTDAEACVTDQ